MKGSIQALRSRARSALFWRVSIYYLSLGIAVPSIPCYVYIVSKSTCYWAFVMFCTYSRYLQEGDKSLETGYVAIFGKPTQFYTRNSALYTQRTNFDRRLLKVTVLVKHDYFLL